MNNAVDSQMGHKLIFFSCEIHLSVYQWIVLSCIQSNNIMNVDKKKEKKLYKLSNIHSFVDLVRDDLDVG